MRSMARGNDRRYHLGVVVEDFAKTNVESVLPS
jgi:hypothetical protein